MIEEHLSSLVVTRDQLFVKFFDLPVPHIG
jgi:hypothetical protein